MPALVSTPLCTLASATDGMSSGASSAGTPEEGDYLVAVCVATGTTAQTPTLASSANDITWTLAGVAQANSNSSRLYVFVADQLVGPSPAPMSVSMSGFNADSATGWFICVLRCTGYGAVPEAAVGVTNNKAGATPATVALPAAATSGNVVVAAQTAPNNPLNQTPPSGWVESFDLGISTPTFGLHVMGRSNFTGSSVTWSSNSGAGGAVIAELREVAPPVAQFAGWGIPI